MLLALLVNGIGFVLLLTQTFHTVHQKQVRPQAQEVLLVRWILLILIIMMDNVCLGISEILPFGGYIYNYYKLMVFLSKNEFHVRMTQKLIIKADPDVLGDFSLGLLARFMIRIMHKACNVLKYLNLPVSQTDFHLTRDIMEFLEAYHPRIITTSSGLNTSNILDTSLIAELNSDELEQQKRMEEKHRRLEEKERKKREVEEEMQQQEEQIRLKAEELAHLRKVRLEEINRYYEEVGEKNATVLDAIPQPSASATRTKDSLSQNPILDKESLRAPFLQPVIAPYSSSPTHPKTSTSIRVTRATSLQSELPNVQMKKVSALAAATGVNPIRSATSTVQSGQAYERVKTNLERKLPNHRFRTSTLSIASDTDISKALHATRANAQQTRLQSIAEDNQKHMQENNTQAPQFDSIY